LCMEARLGNKGERPGDQRGTPHGRPGAGRTKGARTFGGRSGLTALLAMQTGRGPGGPKTAVAPARGSFRVRPQHRLHAALRVDRRRKLHRSGCHFHRISGWARGARWAANSSSWPWLRACVWQRPRRRVQAFAIRRLFLTVRGPRQDTNHQKPSRRGATSYALQLKWQSHETFTSLRSPKSRAPLRAQSRRRAGARRRRSSSSATSS
jgi:hypothetical protein